MLSFRQSLAAIALSSVLAAPVAAYDSPTGDFAGNRDAGKEIARNRSQGNCLSSNMFGKHEVLTEEEFNDVVEYVWSL